uniref:Fatty acid synthase n=1 Tax=Caenorhabditis japonica TaxID=281687 RepID=A0A8R1DEI4_CAEJA
MIACLVGSWAKIPHGEDELHMAENVFLNRDNIAPLPEDKWYLNDFREKHPNVKCALVDGIEYFDDQYFGTGESESLFMDPQQRMLMQGVVLALENAGITLEMASAARISVYTAAWCYDYKDLLPPDQYMATGNSASVMCGRITYFLNSRGAAVGIETACSSSLVAFHLARQAILCGETKLALVCGANHVGSRSFHSLYNSHMVSPNGRLAAFDRSANGFVRAESFAVAVLCSKKFAEENNLRIHCECIGSAYNSDGRTPSLTAPNPISQYEVQLQALKGVNRDEVQLVTCHGTGTKLGDQVELTAIKKSFKPDIKVMSPKSSIGHGEGAAGLIGVLQSLYSMQQGIIPNQLHLQLPTEDLGEEKSMVFVNEEMDLKKVAISSYGFGGTNACAIIMKPEPVTTAKADSYAESNVLFLSAKSHESLKQKIEDYAEFFEHSDSLLPDILYTVNERKTKYDVRAAVFGKNREEMARKLRNGDFFLTNSQNTDFEVEFGEGNEKLWLLRMLYESNETFHLAVDKYCKLAEYSGFPEARTALFFPFKLTLTPLTYNISRLISSMATFELLIKYNTLPNKLKGKGLGQIFCLAAAQVITFENAVQLIKGVIAESNMAEIISNIDLKQSKIAIVIQKLNIAVKKILPVHISGELSLEARPNLMTFNVNGKEIIELDPIVKVQKLNCQLFVSGFDPAIIFRGKIVKTPGYSFLKRRFWPEPLKTGATAITDAAAQDYQEKTTSLSATKIETVVKDIVKQFLDIVEDDINLLETGTIDSLTSIEMIEAFGSAVGQTMPFDLLETYPTTRNIIDFLTNLVSSAPVSKASVAQNSPIASSNTDVHVISSDFMFAGVDGEKELWDALLTSKLVTNKVSETRKKQIEGDPGLEVGLLKQDISLFDNSFFSITKDEAEFLDPQHRLLLHSAYNALEKTGLLAIPDADIFLAISSHSEYRTIAEKHVDQLDERLWMGTVHSMAAGRLAALFGIRGKAVLVDTTCSSIASALEMAVNSIREGKEYAVVATSQLIQSSKWLYSLKSLLDHSNTKSFSVDGHGFCRSDGVGVIILKAAAEGDHAVVRISNATTHHSGAVVTPVISSIFQLLEDIEDISYVEGHGTATIAGDSAESIAYQKLGQQLVMSSVKAQFGHCEVASGLIQLMKVASLTKHGLVPAIVHNYLPNEHIRNNDNIRLLFVSEECDIGRSAIVSFGITGTKTAVVTEKIFNTKASDTPNQFLFPISAKTKDGLKKAVSSLMELLENTSESLYDISTTLQKQKTNFKWRTAVVGSNYSQILKRLKRVLNTEEKRIPTNWHIPTDTHSIGCSSFFNSIPEFENHYSTFCNRLRFEPHSDAESAYHVLSVVYALLKTIISHKITNSFSVAGSTSLILLAAIDAAPSHYLNDLIHAFVNNDVRMMKRIARDVTIHVENVEIYNLKGERIETARQAVEAAIDTEPKHVRLPEEALIFSPNAIYPQTEPLQTIADYFEFIGEQFIQGRQIDFVKIFGKPHNIVNLPEYPFNRKSFWLPINTNLQITQPKTELVVSLKDYEFVLNSEKWKHVKNHVIDSQIVLPGATSIRLVHQIIGKPSIALSNIDFLNKITPSELPVSVTLKEQTEATNLMFGNTHAISFTISESKRVDSLPNERLQAEVHHSDDIYHRFATSHLTYRNEFQMIDSLRYTMGRGEVRFVEIQQLDILIDGALQAIVGCYFFENSHDNSPFVPFTIDKLAIFTDDLAHKQLHTILTYDSTGNFITGDATVYDDSGNTVLHIANATFKRLNSNGQSANSIVSKSVNTLKLRKGVENEQAKQEARNMLHLWFEENFGWTDLDDTTGFFDFGLSSIQAVKLRNFIKSNYPDASSTCVFDYSSIRLLSGYLSTLQNPNATELMEDEKIETESEEDAEQPATRLALNPIGVKAAACRLPGGVASPAELWELLKIGKNASSRIPAKRVPTRNNLISGTKYGNSVEGGNFISQDISEFDPAFFKISKSEAEFIDPQQRILLECVQECFENSGVTETNDVGVFVGLMEKEYQDMVESSSILSMLGSMAAVIAGRINYVFGCHGPSVTIDTACSSSLVALEMAINALLDHRCSHAIVAGVNLILNEKGQGLRTNGKMLSQHGMSLSFDSRASGYGRSDGCVVLMLELAKPNFHYMSTIQSVNVNHGGKSVSLTAPNGVAHKMLITSVINQSPSLSIDYWEAHGTGTPLGDPIEFNTLSSILQNIMIGSVKASLGHGEASAGTCGLLKLFLMLTYQYVPTLIHFHVLNKDINAGTIRLPIIGEDSELVSAGISSFGVSGTNAAAIAFNDNNKLEPYTAIHKHYILPISAKNQMSLDELEKQILDMIPLTDVPISSLASALANNRSHFQIRNALIVRNSGQVVAKVSGKLQRIAKKDKVRVKIGNGLLNLNILQYDLISEMYTIAALKNPQEFAIMFSVIKLLTSLSEYVEIVASDAEELLAILLADGFLQWDEFDKTLLDLPMEILLNELAEKKLNKTTCPAIKCYQAQPESETIDSLMEMLQFIVKLYINGYDLNWSTVYTPVQQFVALPNYHFNKQSIWFEDRNEVIDHYLIGTVDEEREDVLTMKNQISELRHPQLFKGKPLDVGTIVEIAIEALKVRNSIPFSLQNLITNQIILEKPVWLKTVVTREEEGEEFIVKGYIDEKELFTLTASQLEQESIEVPAVEVQIPDKILYLRECPSAIIRRNRNLVYVDSRSEPSPFRTANIVLNEIIGFNPNPSDMFLEILGVLPDVYYMVQVDDGALWQFQMLSDDKQVLSNIYVLKDAKGLEVPTIRMHKKSTLLSSQEASVIAAKTLQMDIRNKVRCACNDVIDSGIEIEEHQMSSGFSEFGMDSLATVDLVNRLNQKYFPEIELTTSDLFDNPNIIDLSVYIEQLLQEKGIDTLQSEPPTPKMSLRERKLSIPAVRAQELAQIEFVEQYNVKQAENEEQENVVENDNANHAENINVEAVDRTDIRRKISTAVFDLATEQLTVEDLDSKGFTELGMDSLSIVDFVNRLNEKYFPGEEITASDVFDYPTVDELADHITRKKSMCLETAPDVDDVILQENSASQTNKEVLKDITLLTQCYLLIEENQKPFDPTLILTSLESNIQLIHPSKKEIVLQLNIDGGQEKVIKQFFTENNRILIRLDDSKISIEKLYMTLLSLMKSLSQNRIKCQFAVSRKFTVGNSIARAFLKTVAAEKNPLLSFEWDQKIQQVSFIESEMPISGSWLITGGLSGIGFEIGKYLANNGAENIILISRRQPNLEIIEETRRWKAKVHTIASDICDKKTLIEELTKLKINVTGIIHSAGVLRDSKIERQTTEYFRQVFNPKADGFMVLEEIEKHFHYKIENFIVMSSFTAACGNEGQLNYGVANAYLEHHVQRRRAEKKSGCAIQWGNWIDTGMATKPQVRKFLADLGFLGQHTEDALKYLKVCIEKKPELLMVANIDWKVILKNRKDLPRDLINDGIFPFENVFVKSAESEISPALSSAATDFEEEVSINVAVEDEEEILELLKEKISLLIKCPPGRLKNNKSFMSIGLDSRLLTELLNFVNTTFKTKLNLSDAYNHSTLEKLAGHIWENVSSIDKPSGIQEKDEQEKDVDKQEKQVVDIKKSNDFCPVFGVNVFFDKKEHLEKAKSKALSLLETGRALPATGIFAVPVVGASITDVITKIKASTPQQIKTCQNQSKSVLMLTGQGSQYPMMGRQLVESYEVFRKTLETCLSKCDEYLQGDVNLWEILFDPVHYQKLQLTKHMQPIMFCFGYAAAQLWLSFGIVPDYYLGHSVGELVAGVLAGIMSLEDGLRLIVARGNAMENIAGLGALLAVQKEIADDVLRNFKVTLATINSPKQVVFAGTKPELDKALAYVKGKGKQGTFVNLLYPFHSNLIEDSHLTALRQCLADIQFRQGTTPLVSNVTGQIINTFSEAYIIKHTISAVKFVNCVETLKREGITVWIDAGPAAVLATFVKRIIPPAELSKHRVVQTCKEKDSDAECLVQSCLELEQSGLSVNWSKIYGCLDHEDSFLIEFPVFQKHKIESDEFEILEGHRLNGRIIVAGAYQMFKMDQLVKSKAPGLDLGLKNVKFEKPWFIEDCKDFEIRWKSNMVIELTVNSIIVCSAKVELKEGSLKMETIGDREKAFDVHDFYETLYRNGLQYESGFRRMETAKRSDTRCFANIKSSPFAWPIIDSAMHSITASVVIRRPDCYFLPVAMGFVSLKNETIFKKSDLRAQTVITSENEKFIQVNVILSSQNETICEVRNMTIVVLKLVPVVTPTPTPNFVDINEKDPKLDVNIVGFDITLPNNQISTNSESWQFLKTSRVKQKLQLRRAKDERVRVSLLDTDTRAWDPEYFGIRPSEAKFLDPQQRLLLTSVAKLLDSTLFSSLPSNTGVFIGCSTYEFSHIVYAHGYKDPRAEWGGGTSNSALAGRIAHWLKLKGPVTTVDTACSSSFHALSLACDAIQSGKCDHAIVGAVNLVLHEMTTDVLENAQMTVSDFCKAFDVDANGYKRSEAVCSLLLSKSDKSKSIATIASWATGHNGNSSSLFTPNGKSQLEVMQKATRDIDVISGVEMHCTGTKLGDPIEANAVSKLIMGNCAVNSIKSNVGHAEGASGLVSLCSLLMSFQSRYKPAQLHIKCLNEAIRGSAMHCRFVGEELDLTGESAFVINNFGFTGSNCSVAVKPRKIDNLLEQRETVNIFYPMLLSAHTSDTLQRYVEKFLEFVALSDSNLDNIMHSLLRKKVHVHRHYLVFNYKRQVVASSENKIREMNDERLDSVLRLCSIFIKDGKIPLEKKRGYIRTELPPIIFKNNLHWNLDPFHDEVDVIKKIILNEIFYEKVLVELPMTKRTMTNNIVCLGKIGNFPSITIDNISKISNGIIVFHPSKSSIEEYLELTKLWSILDVDQNVLVIVACFKNSTSHSEWTGTLRSLAAEKLLQYKFVSIENLTDLEFECTTQDVFECIFNINGRRLTERLKKITPSLKTPRELENVLVSGGTGGIGNAVLEELKPRKVTVISRKKLLNEEYNGKLYINSDVLHFESTSKFKNIFHFAGVVENASHAKMDRKLAEEIVSVKLHGAQNLAKYCSPSSTFTFSSSIACILGSFGQSNYTFANGLATSFLETSNLKSNIIHWGPWAQVGMLARTECTEINKQLKSSGWEPLSNDDALSVFYTDCFSANRQVVVFDGNFETILSRQPHLRKFLSDFVKIELPAEPIKVQSTFESIFHDVVGIKDMNSKTDVPFMDLGIDSLCMENLRHTLNVSLHLELTVSEIFENATYQKLQKYVSKLAPVEKTVKQHILNEEKQHDEDNRVAVIGWSAEFTGAANIEEFWNNLLNGVVSTKTGSLKSPFGFDNKFFNITDEDAKMLDPQVRKFIQHAYLAMENAGYAERRNEFKCAVFAGAEPSNYGNVDGQEDAMRKMFVMNMNNYLATYASYCLDLKGEAVSVYSACSTTLVAVANAVKSILTSSIDCALVGAASISEETDKLDGRNDAKKTIFSKSGICRPFDKNSEGIVRGSGVGCLMLKQYSRAIADGDNIHFVIKDFGISNDGISRASFMAPNPTGQLNCMTEVLNRLTEEEKRRIDYVECHATGTTLGDSIELNSLRSAYAFKSKLRIGSCKANIGHVYAASGLAALIKCAKMLQTGSVPPQTNFSEFRENPKNFFNVQTDVTEIDPVSLISLDSFGIGGTNVHMIIELPTRNSYVAKENNGNNFLIPISAKNEISLNALKEIIENKLQNCSDLNQIQSTYIQYRAPMNCRSYLCASDRNGRIKITRGISTKLPTKKNSPKIGLFFAPQGLQFSQTLIDEYHRKGNYRKEIEHLCATAERLGMPNLEDVLYPPLHKQDDKINETQFAQVALFIQCIAVLETLKNSLKPAIVIGHSVGEYAAATVSGVLDSETMLQLLMKRAELISRTEKASMLMIWNYYKPLPKGIEVSAIVDSNTMCVVGPIKAIEMFKQTLSNVGIKFREIRTNHGFHSSMLKPIAHDFKKVCDTLPVKTPSIPIISSITGLEIQEFDSSYCVNHLLHPVNLNVLVDRLATSDIDVIVEIGPTGVLSNLLTKRNSKIVVIPTCGTKKNPENSLTKCIGQLWNCGVDIRGLYQKGKIDGSAQGYCFDEKLFLKTPRYAEKIATSKFEFYKEIWLTVDVLDSSSNPYLDFCIYDPKISQNSKKSVSNLVVPLYQAEDIHENFFEIKKLLKTQFKIDSLIFVAMDNSSSVHLVLGLLRCYRLQTKQKLKYVENFERLPISEVVSRSVQQDGLYLRVTTSQTYEYAFQCIPQMYVSLSERYGTAIVFGANGFVGTKIALFLESVGITVIRVSRSRNSTYFCDITDPKSVEQLLEKLNKRSFTFVINCAGKESSKTIHKTFEEQKSVLSVKTHGNLNILNCLEAKRIRVEKFVAFSSLSSVVPLFGNEDYASANCFIENLSRKIYISITNILTLSLPPIQESRMYEDSSPSTKDMLKEISMNSDELCNVFRRALFTEVHENIFVSSENPYSLAERSLIAHRTDENENKLESINFENHLTTEETLSQIWKETLGSSLEIEKSSNFFSLGGDSLSALQVVWQVQKKLGKVLQVNDLFDNPTLQSFSKVTDFGNTEQEENEIRVKNYDEVPLTHAQTQMFMLRQIDVTSRYNIIFEIRIKYNKQFNWKFLKYSILSLIAYQTSYRSVFKNSIPPRQNVYSLTESFHDLDKRCDLTESVSHERNHSFEISKMTPLRVRIAEDYGDNQIHIVFNQHHILTDGWSMTVLADTINSLYNAYERNSEFPERLNQSVGKVAIKESEKSNSLLNESLDYFKKSNHTVIPYDMSCSTVEDHMRFTKSIPAKIWNNLTALSKLHSTTNYNIALTVFCQCIRSFTGHSDLLLAYANSQRDADNSKLIGYFMNNTLFQVSFPQTLTNFEQCLENVLKSLESSRKFSSVPFHKIVERKRELNAISVFFNFRQKLDYPTVTIAGSKCEVVHLSLNNAFDFSFTIDETPTGSVISIDYDGAKYLESTVNTFAEVFLKMLNFSRKGTNRRQVIKKTDFPLSCIQNDLLKLWKQSTELAFSSFSKTFSYEFLAEEVEKTAKCIQKQFQLERAAQIREDDLIGLDCSFPPISLLACSLLGVAYSPIDPTWPKERQLFVKSKVNLMFAYNNSRDYRLRNFKCRTHHGGIYTIFTSGSTGVPKGVFMAESSVCSFVTSATKQCMFRGKLKVLDSVKQVFDVSVANIFGSVLNIGALVSPGKLNSITDELEKCEYAFLPAAVFNGMTTQTMNRLRNIETLTVGGETVSDEALRNAFRLLPKLRIIQIYGPTETCVWSLTNRCKPSMGKVGARLGKSMENEYYETPNDAIRGNLSIKGLSLARGYLGSENPTTSTFSNVYSTGDIVDFRKGHIEYIGRVDNQVKWKGFRIDVIELEKELLNCLCLRQIAVIFAKQLLIAFLVEDSQKFRHSELLGKLKDQTYMPDHFVQIDKMPLNSSGKIDKSLLLQAFEQVRKSYKREMITMEHSLEEKINKAVSDIVGQKTSLTDKFTNVGGNSLSAIQLAHRLTEELKFEVKAHDILQSENLKDLSTSLAKKVERPSSTVSNVITKLRKAPDAKFNVYLVHAIGGTIYPYYSFLQIFPKNISVYGIEFDLKYPSGDLRELAHFYAKEIAAHAGDKRIFVMGHSMGGIMSREIVAELKIWGYDIPFVILFDSWVLRTNELDVENIRQFITYVFSGLPDSEHRIDRAMKLAQLLREYKTTISDTKLYLFKSKKLGDAAFKKAVRTDLNEELSRSMTCNGFDELSLQPIETFLIDGDHESCLKIENLRKVEDFIMAPFKPYLN